jgi:hypothetical protein
MHGHAWLAAYMLGTRKPQSNFLDEVPLRTHLHGCTSHGHGLASNHSLQCSPVSFSMHFQGPE